MTDKSDNKSTNEKLIHAEMSYQLVGILFTAHKTLGRFAREKQYGDFIEKELQLQNVPYKREFPIGSTGNIADFMVDEKIILEIKAVIIITDECYRQVQNYLQQSKLRLGLLVNFHTRFLKPHRVIRVDH